MAGTATATAENPVGGGRRRAAALVRLAMLAAAAALGAWSFRDFADLSDRWSWLAKFAAAAVLATAALSEGPRPCETRRRRDTRRAAGAIALLCTAAALAVIPRPGWEELAAATTVAALLSFAAARWLPFRDADVRALLGPAPLDPPPRRRWSAPHTAATVLALIASAAALVCNERHHAAGFALWASSLALFAAGNWPRRGDDETDAKVRLDGGPPPSAAAEWTALLVIIAAAALLRFLWIDRFPLLIEGDEGRQALSAEAMWAGGFPNLFDLGWNGFPNLSYLVEWSGVLLFGKSNANFRLAAPLIGTLSLVPLYLWARRWWGVSVALIATLLLAINREHLMWSRWAFNNIHQVLIAGLVLAAFARLLRHRRRIDWVWLGYSMALGFHTYHATKLYPLLIAAAASLLALGIPGFARRYAPGALLGALAFALCVGPLALTTVRKWEMVTRENNRFDVHQLADAWRADDVARVRDYVYTHVGGCLISFTHLWKTREAFFAPAVAIPFWMGLCWMLWGWRDPRHLVVLVWIGGILAIGGMITSYPPWKPRLLGLLPAACVVAAVVAGRVRVLLGRVVGARADFVFAPLLVVWIGAALWRNLDTEFVYRPLHQRGDPMTSMVRAIEAMPRTATLNILGGEPHAVVNHGTIAEQPRRRLVGPALDSSTVPVTPDVYGSAVYLVTRAQRSLLPLLRHYYPDARELRDDDMFGNAVLWTFTLDDLQLASHRALRRITDAASGGARWRGSFQVPTTGAYALRSPGAAVRVDGRPLAEGETACLVAGWHTLAIDAASAEDAPPQLEWRPRTGHLWSQVPRENLSDHPVAHGLLGRYYDTSSDAAGASPLAAVPTRRHIETALSFDWSSEWEQVPPPPLAARPSTMEWSGAVHLDEAEASAVRLTSSSPARLFLDGELVAESRGGNPAPAIEVGVETTRREMELLLRVRRGADGPEMPWILALEWRRPGGDWSAFADYRPPADGAACEPRGAGSS